MAFANLFLGVPFHFDSLQRPVVTGSFFSLLHPFALLGGIISLSMMILHGNAYAALKVGEPMAARARLVGRAASVVFLLAFLGAGYLGVLGAGRIRAEQRNGSCRTFRSDPQDRRHRHGRLAE